MSRRLLILASVLAVLGTACSAPPQAEVNLGSGLQFVPHVADSQDNVGLDPAVAVGKDGVPVFSYFGFPAELKQGEIPQARPVYAPTLPAVLLASASDGLWQRGAAAVWLQAPTGLNYAFGPQEIPALKTSLSPQTINGTDVALDAKGTISVVWASSDGIWYSSGTTYQTAEQVYPVAPPLTAAGPVGWPSVAVDDSGAPWVAFTVDSGSGQSVMLATKKGSNWKTTEVANIPLCAGCPQPARTEVGVTPGGPVVAYADGGANAVMLATQSTGAWTTQTVESGVMGSGLSLAVDGSGNVDLTYYGGDGQAHFASNAGGSWNVSAVGTSGKGEADAAGTQTTGVAVDGSGAVYAAWVDGDTGTVKLASSTDDGATFAPIDTRQTANGSHPAVGVTVDGSQVYLAWYDTVNQNLNVGTYGQTKDLLIANPSPLPTGLESPVRPIGCSPNGTKVTVVAQNTTFDTNCLATAAGTTLTVDLQNKDQIAHNFVVYTADPLVDKNATALGGAKPFSPVNGGQSATFPIDIAKPGTYFFRCDFHPTTMVGQYVVTK